MPDVVPDGQPVNSPVAANEKGPDFLFPATSNSEWEEKALEKTREITDKKTLGVLNGLRVTAWRICVEKKRREWAAVFGFSPGQLVEFPPDCRGKVLEFLAPEQSSGMQMLTPAEWRRRAAKRRAEVVDQWCGIVLGVLGSISASKGWSGMYVKKSTINRQNAGDTLGILADGENRWDFPPFLAKLRTMGYDVAVEEIGDDPDDDDPYVLSLGVSL